MVNAKGIVDLVVRNKDTLEEISRTTYENKILINMPIETAKGTKYGATMAIVIGTSTDPFYITNDIMVAAKVYARGYLDPATVSPQWFNAVGAQPAYVQYKNRFDPPATGTTRSITSVQLSDVSQAFVTNYFVPTFDTAQTYYGEVKVYAGFIMQTPCIQTDTQVLDIYYRIQYVPQTESTIDPSLQYMAAKYHHNLATYGLVDTVIASPYPMKQNVNRITMNAEYRAYDYSYNNGWGPSELAAYTISIDQRLVKRNFSWVLPLASEVGRILGTYGFAVGTVGLFQYGGINTIASGYSSGSRTQPVHNHNAAATVPFIDVNTLANGSGIVAASEVASGWTSVSKYPELYKIEMKTGGDVGTSAYKIKVRNHLGFAGNTFTNRCELVPYFTADGQLQNYRNATVHGVVPEVGILDLAERYDIDTLITANATGVTKANIVTGEFRSWNATTIPTLPVTNVVDLRYDSTTKTIWVACKDTGLYTIRADAPYTVTKVTNIPAQATSKCYAIDIGHAGSIWALFDGALCQTTDQGATWIAYHPTSTIPFSYVGVTDGNWNLVRSIRCDTKSARNQMILITLAGSVWFSTAAPTPSITARYWRTVFISGTAPLVPLALRLTQMQFKDAAGVVLTGSGTAMSSLTTTSATAAFDASGVTYYESSTARETAAFWIGYDFGTNVNVQKATFKIPATSVADTGIVTTLQYSSDGITWDTSAYLGIAATTAVNVRSFGWVVNTTINLVAITAWPLVTAGPNLADARINRNAIAYAPYSSHLICFTGAAEMSLQAFGTTLKTQLLPSSNTRATCPTAMTEIDPTTGKTGFLYLWVDTTYATAPFMCRPSIRSGFGEVLTAGTPWLNMRAHASKTTTINLLEIAAGTVNVTSRMVYMGKGIVTFLKGTYPLTIKALATMQVLLGSTTIDGGAFSSIVWDSYGWDGSIWVRDGVGTKLTHSAPATLINGIQIQFSNAASGVSFTADDHYNFGVCEGVWKDNATTVNGSYSFYYKPTTHGVSSFSTSTVQQITGPVGQATMFFGSRGAQWLTDPSQVVVYGATNVTKAAYMKQLLIGNFEVQFTLPASAVGVTQYQFGLVPADLRIVTSSNPYTDPHVFSLRGAPSTVNGTARSGAVGVDATVAVINFAPGKMYTFKRVGTTVTLHENGTLRHTFTGGGTLQAYRPFMVISGGVATGPTPMPSVSILSNGQAYAAYFGSAADNTGVFSPNFYAVDDSTLSTLQVNLDGIPTVTKWTTYGTSVGVGEILVDGRGGIIFFNAADAGKTITGSFTQINE